jgi:putative FmdB family regulatory protein
MPLFEYVCDVCEHRFEQIVNASSQPRCPECDSAELRKLHSTFAVPGSARAPRATPSYSPGGG